MTQLLPSTMLPTPVTAQLLAYTLLLLPSTEPHARKVNNHCFYHYQYQLIYTLHIVATDIVVVAHCHPAIGHRNGERVPALLHCVWFGRKLNKKHTPKKNLWRNENHTSR